MLTIKQMILSDWHFMRLFRLGIGLFIGYQAWHDSSVMIGALAGIFIFQAVTNTGCCASGGCAVSTKPESNKQIHDVHFEEVKSEKNL